MTVQTIQNLFKPLKVGRLELKHRIVMPPLSRVRASADAITNDDTAAYYGQRASAPGTLLIVEGTFITDRAGGFPGIAGIWTKEQIAAWKKVADAVHAKGSFVFLQLAASGRIANPAYLKSKGYDMVSSSNLVDTTNAAGAFTGEKEATAPRALTVAEVKEYVQDFARAAENAIEAGFDGIEVHGANGFLVEQFLKETANDRTDEYGGSVENRSRFALEVVDAISAAIGADRTAIRLSPYEVFGGMVNGPGTIEQYAHVLKAFEDRALADESKRLAYIHTIENTVKATNSAGEEIEKHPLEFVRYVWSGPWIRTQGYNRATALEATDVDDKLLIGIGKHFISNPDLVRRFKEDLPLNDYNYATFYGGTSEGLLDYPFYDDVKK